MYLPLITITEKRRSEPSLVQPECRYEQKQGVFSFTESEIQGMLDAQKENVKACWSLPMFSFVGKKDDGTEVPLHFLEYAGTRQLAEDIVRFMDLIEAEKLSLYGVSYGTNVMGTLATLFPHKVDKFVIDSNVYATKIMNQNPAFLLFWNM